MAASSLTGKKGVGVPTMLFHEGEGLTVTIETKSGMVYRGRADAAEDNMNVSMRYVTATDAEGRTSQMDRVFIRGSQIVFVIYPDILKHSPMFERVRRIAAGRSVAFGLGKQRLQAIDQGKHIHTYTRYHRDIAPSPCSYLYCTLSV
jgi:small nuclear ribonucleoprotein D3